MTLDIELDINPVLAGPDGVVAVDAKLRLAPVGAEPDPMLRALRPADISREETPS
uniref:acetate--CoA ligase family protein n=1 Tax=Paractinoplanes polyasparticus TaxID=2856853 RepID=UPI001C852888|nr:acetate--CoA ligase family protein [Actinoplanes polyasparticus]